MSKIIHPRIIADAGPRDRRKAPAFLSTNEIKCPRCGRVEYANSDAEKVVMCSLCLMGLTMGKGTEIIQENQVKPLRFRNTRALRMCERCRETFKGRSNRQRFCEACQRGARNEKTAARTRKWRQGQNGQSVVTL